MDISRSSRHPQPSAAIRSHPQPSAAIESFFDYPKQATDISSGASKAGNELVLINQSSPEKARVPDLTYHAAIGDTWRNNTPAFDESSWQSGSLGVGFERSNGFQNEFGIDVESAWAVNSSVSIRVPIPGTLDRTTIQSLTLRMKYDDGFAAFINGTYATGANDPALLTWNSDSDGDVSDADEGLRRSRFSRFRKNRTARVRFLQKEFHPTLLD